jgi:hypothetical protein
MPGSLLGTEEGHRSRSSPRPKPVEVYLEVGPRRTFACALDWPGWCRSGKTADVALEALAMYAERYAVVADRARVAFTTGAADHFKVVEELSGSAGTDFGVPERTATADSRRLTTAKAQEQAALLCASWDVFADVVADAPAELRKGPRGGGRDRDKVVEHVVQAEAAYARKLGIRRKPPASEDTASIGELRAAIVDVLSRSWSGEPLVENGWRPRYAARRIAWHVLDHAWEIEDRSVPG